MSESPLDTQGGLEAQRLLPVRRMNNFVFCPRRFFFQWVESIFQESADSVAGSRVHRNVDTPSRLDEEKARANAKPANRSRCRWVGLDPFLGFMHQPWGGIGKSRKQKAEPQLPRFLET